MLRARISPCRLCPRQCLADRSAGDTGWCRMDERAIVASYGPHFGEESVLVGSGGSGTIFFSSCNLDCVYCQNWEISHSLEGAKAGPQEVARIAMRLAALGCENINFVTPTHVAHVVAETVLILREAGVLLPIVYNCGGYEAVETLRLLDGFVDIYMPDFKYASDEAALRYSGIPRYRETAEAALAEMYRQVGPLRVDRQGRAVRGLLVRHLVLPGDLSGSADVLDTVARIAPGCAINVMDQYRSCFRARNYPELMGRPSPETIHSLRLQAQSLGLLEVSR